MFLQALSIFCTFVLIFALVGSRLGKSFIPMYIDNSITLVICCTNAVWLKSLFDISSFVIMLFFYLKRTLQTLFFYRIYYVILLGLMLYRSLCSSIRRFYHLIVL